jgi:hypothetical protein
MPSVALLPKMGTGSVAGKPALQKKGFGSGSAAPLR